MVLSHYNIAERSSKVDRHNEAGHLIGEYDGSTPIQETVWLGDIPVATLRGLSIYYVHTDHLNAPKMVTQPSGNTVRWRWDRDPFGATTVNENPSGLGSFAYNPRLPGQFYDSETGLHYNYFRDYDPQIGRYVQSDSIGLAGGINTYSYVKNDPNLLTDPTGLNPAALCLTNPGLCAAAAEGVVAACKAIAVGVSALIVGAISGSSQQCDRKPTSGYGGGGGGGICPPKECPFAGLAGVVLTGAYGSIIQCSYRCPNKGIRIWNLKLGFRSDNPAFLCPPTRPESIFSD